MRNTLPTLLPTQLTDGRLLVLFGLAIDHLPDFLSDHTLTGGDDRQRVEEILNRWTQLVLGLRKWEGSAFALRFVADPARGQTHVTLLARILGRPDLARQHAQHIAADLAAQLTGFGFGHHALDDAALQTALNPFNGAHHLLELRQHSEVTHFLLPPPPPAPPTERGRAFVVHPFWSAAGTLLLPFELLLRQPAPVAVSLYLEPTALEAHEAGGLTLAAQIAQTYSEQTVKAFSDATPVSRRDPVAGQVARIYSALAGELVEPFIIAAQIAGPDPATLVNVGRAWGAAITAEQPHGAGAHGAGDERRLPSNFDLLTPRNDGERAALQQTFTHLLWRPWQTEQASPDKQRLAYLAGARGAAALFRPPISVRGGVPGIAVRQAAPDFEPGPRPQQAAADELHLGSFRRGGAVTIPLKQLTRHVLITGFTGAGKTNTVLYLLDQLWNKAHIPFLVIEAAKKEYRGLIRQPGLGDVLVFTLGDETTAPFRLNPFELLPGVRLEAHLGGLQTCFDAALPQFGILPSIVGEALETIYTERGWQLTDFGTDNPDKLFPTMRDMLRTVIAVAESRGYAGETYHNIRAAAAGRIGNLLRGSRGRMFDCQRSIGLEVLMQRPVVLELNDLNQNDKALTMMFLLLFLREYRELHRGKRLVHVTVVEEAHNVMENVQSVGASEVAADTRAKAVEAFAALLAEVRAYGEGIIISDQSPEKLAPDAVRNTNLQIAHQLRHKKDREAIAAAMIMTPAQVDFLGKLRVGEAAVFMTGYDRATFMRAPNYKDDSGFRELSDAEVAQHMAPFRAAQAVGYLPFDGCRFCTSRCKHRDALEPQTRDPQLIQSLQKAVMRFDEFDEESAWPDNWRGVAAVCRAAARRAGRPDDADAAWCFLAHEIDFPFTEHMRDWFSRSLTELGGTRG